MDIPEISLNKQKLNTLKKQNKPGQWLTPNENNLSQRKMIKKYIIMAKKNNILYEIGYIPPQFVHLGTWIW